jgi:hypothetical protein
MGQQWSASVFDKVAEQTQLGPRTREACRRVLVNGEKGVEVAKDMGILSAQISRGVSGLRRQLVELGDLSTQHYEQAVGAHRVETDTSRDMAVRKARDLVGESLVVKDALPGQVYIGKPLIKTPHHVVQSTGREAVIHELAKLERAPNMNFPMLEVKYPADGRLASVQETAPGQERGGRSR